MFALKWYILALAVTIDQERQLDRLKNPTLVTKRRPRRLRNVGSFHKIRDAKFVKTFRLRKKTVRALVEELSPLIAKPRRNDGISVETKILIALAFYASGSYQSLVRQNALYKVSQTTVSRAVTQVTEALNKIFHKYVKWPTDSSMRDNIKTKFYQKFHIPGVLGCIDGTHVSIIKPRPNEEQYYNRMGFHSLNVMIVCDSDGNIIYVDSGNPGSVDDMNVWRKNPLCPYLAQLNDDGEQCFLLGDSDYPLSKVIMTPVHDAVEESPEHRYNSKHAAALHTVRRCVETLKARFRCLLAARLHYVPGTASNIINACCVLHNIANKTRARVFSLTPDEFQAEALRQQNKEAPRSDYKHNSSMYEIGQLFNSSTNQEFSEGRELQRTLVNKLCANT